MGAWISDFKKSDAPQFKGKSEKERREMAIAAYMDAKRGGKNEEVKPPFDPDPPSKNKPRTNSDGSKTSPMSRAKQLAKMARDRNMKKESVELEEAHAYSKAANALKDYASKHGGIDKKDFHTAAKHLDNIGKAGLMQKGNHLAKFNNHLKYLDTDVRDRIHMTLKQHGVMESVEENNSAPQTAAHRRAMLPKKVKLKGFGPDAAKGNMGNPSARAALKPKNEENVQELKKSTLGSYIKKASQDASSKAYRSAMDASSINKDQRKRSGDSFAKSMKRQKGIEKATNKLTKEGKIEEAAQFKVDIEGLPPTFIQGKSSAEILANLRKIVKQPSMIKNVERYTDMEVKKAYRQKAQGRPVDEAKSPNPEDNSPASPDEKSMAIKQAEFIEYVAKEIADHMKKNKEFPEWMQNKLSALHQKAKDMHSTLGAHGELDEKE
jgi:hypothetical protein